MIYTSVEHRVADFEKWKAVFNEYYLKRREAGELDYAVYCDLADPNLVTVTNRWESLDQAEKFFNGPDLRAAMIRAGVLGEPKITYLDRALAA